MGDTPRVTWPATVWKGQEPDRPWLREPSCPSVRHPAHPGCAATATMGEVDRRDQRFAQTEKSVVSAGVNEVMWTVRPGALTRRERPPPGAPCPRRRTASSAASSVEDLQSSLCRGIVLIVPLTPE